MVSCEKVFIHCSHDLGYKANNSQGPVSNVKPRELIQKSAHSFKVGPCGLEEAAHNSTYSGEIMPVTVRYPVIISHL